MRYGLLAVSVAAPLPRAASSGTRWWIWLVVFAPLVAALAFVGWCWRAKPQGSKLRDRLGPANWDFSASFGSTLTVFGSLLGTILSASVLPDTSSAPPGTYAALNLLFGVIVVVAPFIYTATQKPEQVHQDSTITEPQYQGYVRWFLIATVMTLWAVIGELATIGLVFNEIRAGGSMPAIVLWVLVVVLVASGGFLFLLAQRRIEAILTEQSATDENLGAKRQEVRQRLQTLGLPNVPPEEQINPSRRGWPLL